MRRGGAGAGGSTRRHPFKMSFEGYGRTFDLRMESNVKKLFHNDLQIIVNSANGTQSKLGLKDIDTSVFYGGYLEREQRSSEGRSTPSASSRVGRKLPLPLYADARLIFDESSP